MSSLRLFEQFRFWVLSSGAGQTADIERQNRFFHYSVFLLLGVPTMVVFGCYNLIISNYPLSLLIFASAIGLTLGWLRLWRTKQGGFVYRLNTFLFGLLLLYMMVLGGEGGAKTLWMYTFPLIAFFLLGKSEGMLWNLGILSSSIFILFFGTNYLTIYPYSAEYKLRFFLSYSIVSAIAFWFEYLRNKYRLGMEEKARQLEEDKLLLEVNIQQRKQVEAEKDGLIKELQSALSEVQTLRGLLPICSYCHKIRDDDGFWGRLESYFQERSDVEFSHGICPDCKEKNFPKYNS